jgi:4-azaleucine resistance transporter AzlC
MMVAMGAVVTPGAAGGARAVAPLAPAVAAFGLTFGVLAREAGFGPLATFVFSATTFAGSAQFAAASVLSAGGTLAAAIAAAVLLNARYVPIGISVAPAIAGPPWRRLLRAQLLVDESWAIGHLGGGRYDAARILGAGLVLYPTWVVSTSLGAVAGDAIGDPVSLGLDAAFPALFLALLAGQIEGRHGRTAAVLGAAIALALVPLVPVGVPIVAAAAACLLGLRR